MELTNIPDIQGPQSPQSELNEATEPKIGLFTSGKGIMLASLMAIVLVGFGIYALPNYSSASKYQGMIQKISSQNQEIQLAQEEL